MTARATSKDVARLAGVAQSTVSYVLSGKGSVSPATRERVLRAAQELRYRPNLAARSMRTRQTGRLAVVMGIPLYSPVSMLAGAGSAAEAAGFTMEVHNIDGTAGTRSERILDLAASGQFEGVLSFAPVRPGLEAGAPEGVPVVTAETFDDEMHSAGDLADPSPVATFVEHLASLGHRRFLHVAGPQQFASAAGRRRAYLETVERLGLHSLGVVGGAWTGDCGLEAIHALPDEAAPLAVIAVNDLVAVGVMRGAAERGWSVPGDVSVTGWDDYDVSRYLSPSLTTVANDRHEAGARAMRHLIAVLRGEEPARDLPSLNRVVWRESTAAPRPSPCTVGDAARGVRR